MLHSSTTYAADIADRFVPRTRRRGLDDKTKGAITENPLSRLTLPRTAQCGSILGMCHVVFDCEQNMIRLHRDIERSDLIIGLSRVVEPAKLCGAQSCFAANGELRAVQSPDKSPRVARAARAGAEHLGRNEATSKYRSRGRLTR